MKRLSLLMLALLFVGGAAFSQITFGPKAGIMLAKYGQNYKDSDMEDYLKYRLGPSFGAVMDMTILDWLSFQPSLLFTKKGTAHNLKKMSDEHPNHTYDGYDRDRVFYLEIPVNFAGKYELGPGSIQVFLGPYFAFALAGVNNYDYKVTRMDGSVDTYTGDDKIKFTGTVTESDMNDDDVGKYMKPFDFGLNFGLGYQWNALLFNIGYNMGLSNLTPDYEGQDMEGQNFDPKDYKNTNQGIFFNVAWLFGAE